MHPVVKVKGRKWGYVSSEGRDREIGRGFCMVTLALPKSNA